MKLNRRYYKLTINFPDGSYPDIELEHTTDSPGLRISFEINALIDFSLNQANITVYNFNTEHRKILDKRLQLIQTDVEIDQFPVVTLELGYESGHDEKFSGTLLVGKSRKNPTSGDWLTELYCGANLARMVKK